MDAAIKVTKHGISGFQHQNQSLVEQSKHLNIRRLWSGVVQNRLRYMSQMSIRLRLCIIWASKPDDDLPATYKRYLI